MEKNKQNIKKEWKKRKDQIKCNTPDLFVGFSYPSRKHGKGKNKKSRVSDLSLLQTWNQNKMAGFWLTEVASGCLATIFQHFTATVDTNYRSVKPPASHQLRADGCYYVASTVLFWHYLMMSSITIIFPSNYYVVRERKKNHWHDKNMILTACHKMIILFNPSIVFVWCSDLSSGGSLLCCHEFRRLSLIQALYCRAAFSLQHNSSVLTEDRKNQNLEHFKQVLWVN